MRCILAIAALAILATYAQAENARVFSGEHENFSRIVIVFSNKIGWDQKKTEQGFEIKFDRENLFLDLSEVFEKIPKDRIESVSYDTDRNILKIGATCSCDMEVFEAGQNALAIDVRTLDFAQKDTLEVGDEIQVAAAFPLGAPGGPSPNFAHVSRELTEAIRRNDESLVQAEALPNSQVKIRTLESALLEQLGRAATQGVAEIDTETPSPWEREHHTLSDNEPKGRHVRTRTVFDIEPARHQGDGDAGEQRTRCYGEDVLDVSKWPSGVDASDSISAARTGLVSELDNPNSKQISSLVRTYLALGFGAEAQAVLFEYGDAVDMHSLYQTLAEVIDDTTLTDELTVLGSTACDGPTALWAFVALDPQEVSSDVNLRAIQAWFVRLPDPLRMQLGPRVVENLLLAGHESEAAVVRDAISRTTERSSVAIKMIDAQTAMAAGGIDKALQEFAEVAAVADLETPDAMAKILRGLRSKGSLSLDPILSAEAVAFEHQGTAPGRVLLEEIIKYWAHLGNFDAGWRAWDDLREQGAPGKSLDRVFSLLVIEMVEKSEDGKLLKFVHSGKRSSRFKSLSREATLILVDWLSENGVQHKANDILKKFQTDNQLDMRQARSKIALMDREFSLAMSYISAENDRVSLQLKAEALASLGDHSSASLLFEEAFLVDDAAREAWLNGGKDRIRALGDPDEVAFIDGLGSEVLPGNISSGRHENAATHATNESQVVGSPASGDEGAEDVAPEIQKLMPVSLARSRELVKGSRSYRSSVTTLIE